MNVPLDNLYHWVDSLVPGPAILYVFHPHGSKKISNLEWLKSYSQDSVYQFPAIFLNDQEPLDWNFYDDPEQYAEWFLRRRSNDPYEKTEETTRFILQNYSNLNFQSLQMCCQSMLFDRCVLIHSEKNSKDLAIYQQNNFLTVHYWAHAVIARDWYRFARLDSRLCVNSQPKNKFLIYCRDWSHRREYRLKFLELLVQNNLLDVSQVNVMHVNSENVHFSQHQFVNDQFKLTDPKLIESVPGNNFASSVSADYTAEDFVMSNISVVLETVFDDSRIHLTEKTLRPIACGHPFILAAGPGALEYIRSYGFKTFAPWIDESYDQETDSLKRLEKIINAMIKIQNLQDSELKQLLQHLKEIASFNKRHFFSEEFFETVQNELKNNLQQAYEMTKYTQGKNYLDFLKKYKMYNLTYPKHVRTRNTKFLRQLRQSYQSDQSNLDSTPGV